MLIVVSSPCLRCLHRTAFPSLVSHPTPPEWTSLSLILWGSTQGENCSNAYYSHTSYTWAISRLNANQQFAMSKCPPWPGWWLFLQKWSDSEGSPWLLASTPVSPSGLTVFSAFKSGAGRRSWGKSHKRFQKILHFFSTLSKDWFDYNLDSWKIGWNIRISLFCRLPWPPPGLPPQNEDLLDLADALADLARAARETRTTLWSALQVSSSLVLVSEISLIWTALSGYTTCWTGSRGCHRPSKAGSWGLIHRQTGSRGGTD